MTKSIIQQADGFYYQDGIRVCEDCWQPIPRYVDFPQGLTSPESAKYRATSVEGKEGIEALRKAVCLPCYHAAFQRAYPGAISTPLSDLVYPPAVRLPIEPEPPLISIAEPRA